MVPGALSVMTTGTSVMQRLSVDSWDLLGHQAQRVLLTLAVELVCMQNRTQILFYS